MWRVLTNEFPVILLAGAKRTQNEVGKVGADGGSEEEDEEEAHCVDMMLVLCL